MLSGKIEWFNKNKGFGFIKGDDSKMYFLHINDVKKKITPAEGARVQFDRQESPKGPKAVNAVFLDQPPSVSSFPYTFIPRPVEKSEPKQHHERLNSLCYDIGFEVRWTALTAVAANPVRETGAGESCLPSSNAEYKGFNRRWLMANGHPVISPFTVKGAVANGVSNLLGSCYRINNRTFGHEKTEGSGDLYPGKYKRYRVLWENSKPAIILKKPERNKETNTMHLLIQPVEEIYCNFDPSLELRYGKPYMASVVNRGHKKFIETDDLCEQLSSEAADRRRVTYAGRYSFGMNCQYKAPDQGKQHKHRFCIAKGKKRQVTLPLERFFPLDALKEIVHMGGTTSDGESRPLWYEDLSTLDNGHWIYYHHTADNEIVDIGRNVLFKSLFLHSDTIPAGHEPCDRVDSLCPRCNLFGMTDTTNDPERKADGYRGRFKSAGLLATKQLSVPEEGTPYNVRGTEPPHITKPLVWRETENGQQILARQLLLPIQGAPKSNKRLMNGKGYFDQHGKLQGAKQVKHSSLDIDRLIAETDRQPATGNQKYSHKLRNWAMVCKEGMLFEGTLCLENTGLDELAALLILLQSGTAKNNFADGSGHGFKIGLGKSFGLGSMTSTIRAIWVRSAEKYEWKKICFTDGTDLDTIISQLEGQVKGISKTVETLKTVDQILERINSLEDYQNQESEFPSPGKNYWDTFSL